MAIKILPKLRLLPVTLAVAGVVFTLRVGDLWQGVAAPGGAAIAAVMEPQPEQPDAAAPEPTAPAASATRPMPLIPGEGMALTQTEIDLLQKLSARREAIEKRERELDMREALVKAAEDRLAAKASELDTLQKNIQALMREHDERQSQKLESLVSIYEKMKPAEAARILEGLEMDILLDVLGQMKVIRSAPILAAMVPHKARAVTERLATRHAPLDATLAGTAKAGG